MDINRTPNDEFLLWLREKSHSLTKNLASVSKLVQRFRDSPAESGSLFQALVASEAHLRDYRNFILWELLRGEEQQNEAPNFRTSDFNLHISGSPARRMPAKQFQLKKK